MRCFRCGGENTRTGKKFDPEDGRPIRVEIPDNWVPFRLGDGQFGPDTKVTLCQSCSGAIIQVLRGGEVKAVPFRNREQLVLEPSSTS